MTTAHTKIFTSNRSQAVRLPKAVELPPEIRQVDIIAVGNTRIITPSGASWESWFDGLGVSADFMPQREQPEGQEREREPF